MPLLPSQDGWLILGDERVPYSDEQKKRDMCRWQGGRAVGEGKTWKILGNVGLGV